MDNSGNKMGHNEFLKMLVELSAKENILTESLFDYAKMRTELSKKRPHLSTRLRLQVESRKD